MLFIGVRSSKTKTHAQTHTHTQDDKCVLAASFENFMTINRKTVCLISHGFQFDATMSINQPMKSYFASKKKEVISGSSNSGTVYLNVSQIYSIRWLEVLPNRQQKKKKIPINNNNIYTYERNAKTANKSE